jgi:predicted lipoprotein with Yx(FWY)xxD motif
MTTDPKVSSSAATGRPGAGRLLPALLAAGALAVVAAACSSTPAASSSTTTTAVSAAASGTTTTAAASSSTETVADSTSSAKIGGDILVNTSGLTLYQLSADTSTKSVCTGTCAAYWPPLTVPAGTTPKGASGVTGTFGTITRGDGSLQATYDGHPLYTFKGDSSPGATNGQDITSYGGKWTVVTVGATSSTPPPRPTTTAAPTGGGYGY